MANLEGVKFRRFDPRTIRDYSSILFVGGKRTGKSSVMRQFMYYLKDRVYDTHVWSGTYDEDHPWEWYTPKQMVHYCLQEFDPNTLSSALATQNQRKKMAAQFGSKCPPSMCVFEDLEFLKPSIWVSQETRGVIFNGRWYKEFFFVAYQYVMEVKMELRGSFDYTVFTMDNSRAVRERIYKQFGGMFDSFENFEAAFMEITKDYRVMVIDMRARSYNVEDCVYWYKADPNLGRFKMGHPDVWVPHVTEDTDKTALSIAARTGQIILVDDAKERPEKKKKGSKKKKRVARRK